MKILTFIFTAYILALSCMPCTDGLVCQNEPLATHNNAHQHKDGPHQHDQDEPETCPPFCLCACCGIPVSVHVVAIKVPQLNDFHKHTVPHYKLAGVAEVFFSIWQPPQLS